MDSKKYLLALQVFGDMSQQGADTVGIIITLSILVDSIGAAIKWYKSG